MHSRLTRLALGGGLVGTLLFVAGLANGQSPPAGVPYPAGYPGPGVPQQPGYLPPGGVHVQPGAIPPQLGSPVPVNPMPPMNPIPVGPMGQADKATLGDGKADGKDGDKKEEKKEEKKDDGKPKMTATWENGVWFRAAENRFVFHLGGTVHYDAAFYQQTPILALAPGGTGKFADGANMRRARLFAEGTLYDAVDFKFELEFMNGLGFSPVGTTGAVQASTVTNAPGPTDAWITIKDVPFFGNVRIGSQKEWFSLEHLNVYRYLEFMERSYLFDFAQPTAFNNGFSPGISVFRTWCDDRVFTAAGVYKNDSDLIGFGLGDGQYAFTGRVAGTPIYEPDDHYFWHVGGAMSHRDPVNGTVQVRIRDDVRNAPFPLLNLIANTGQIPTQSQDLFNLETAAVCGPLTFQAEYTANVLRGASPAAGAPAQGNLFFQGYYAEVLCFLTGESRTWNTKNFFFNRVNVLRPLKFWKHGDGDGDGVGCGAWELGVRYTYLDLSNKFVQAGRLDAITVGLNWYLNSNAKLQWNYDWTQRGDTNTAANGTIHAFGMRCAFDF